MTRNIRLTKALVSQFVNEASKCNFDIDIYYNRYVVDAKSFLGVFGLDLSQILTVTYDGYNKDFEAFIKEIRVAS